jgi:hypothetical protein
MASNMYRQSQFHSVGRLLSNAWDDNMSIMTDIQKDLKNAGQNLQAKAETAKDHAEGKPSSETLNKAKIKGEDVVQDVKRDL